MEKGVTAEAAAAAGAAEAARLWRAGRGTARLLCRPVVALPPGRVLCGCVVDECCEGVEGVGVLVPPSAAAAGPTPLHGFLRGSVHGTDVVDLTATVIE